MKLITLIILILSLMQPIACFAYPCDSCFGAADIADSSGNSGSHPHNHDADSCDSSVCCAACINWNHNIAIIYAPLVSVIKPPERHKKLPSVTIPIFVPPQKNS